MALINTIIPERNFELVRDRIAEILTLELQNQVTLTGNQDINATIFSERIAPFNQSELPAINIGLTSGDYLLNTTDRSDGDYTYYIDIYTKSKTTVDERAYLRATKVLHKLIGIIDYILEDPQYKLLGFQAPSVSNTEVKGFDVADPSNNQDGSSVVQARLTFNVKVNENTALLDAPQIAEFFTQVKMEETDNGYVFSGTGISTDKPTDLVVTGVNASEIQLDWVDNAIGEINYEIWRGLDCDNLVLIDTISSDSIVYNDTGLLANTAYAYMVRPIYGAGVNGNFSDIKIGCTL